MIEQAFLQPIINELKLHPLPLPASKNKIYHFGAVSRRGTSPDYSKLCVSHPRLYELLLNFGKTFTGENFTSIILAVDTPINRVRNIKDSPMSVIHFNEDTEGTLTVVLSHKQLPEYTCTYTLVFYNTLNADKLPPPSISDGVFFRGDVPHLPKKCRTKVKTGGIRIEHRFVQIEFP